MVVVVVVDGLATLLCEFDCRRMALRYTVFLPFDSLEIVDPTSFADAA